ncbi:MAG: patatin-like phospholipase family protein [Candidatus Dormibacteraeota bacterium]|uniref:Patatin-like phospholipase family protein n=1 Tax=Candidatus Amunia macphersoniae TaxID=3127014 RepID=A0A934KJN6_9BACT|nr:patatin-like phospholipase family protein [Candidatus Dormibacteraeota bacterium]
MLCGGGITGLAYEIGALRALDDLLVGSTVNDFDVYVGTSAGSMVGALLANGITPTEMALGVEGTSQMLRPPSRWGIYRPNLAEAASRLLKLPRLTQEIAWELARHPGKLNPVDIAGMLSALLPSGVFSNSQLVRFLERVLTREGFSNDFRRLSAELHIVACALDSGERVVFSRFNKRAHVPISLAAAASTAIPQLFRPVRIDDVDYVDGGIKGISAIDVAVARGATLIVAINPIVPVDTRNLHPPDGVRDLLGDHLADLGMRGVCNQVFRGMLHDGLLDHIKLVRHNHPDVDILLIEPRPDDEKMFFHDLMSYSARLMVLQHGYESVSTGLYDLGIPPPDPAQARHPHLPPQRRAQAGAGAARQLRYAKSDAAPDAPDGVRAPAHAGGHRRRGRGGMRHPDNQEVEKAGGAPVEEGPPTTPEEALGSPSSDGSAEQRPDRDEAGHEPHPSNAG